MSQYVHVLSHINDPKSNINYEIASLNQTNHILISLIQGLRQKRFGYDTIKKIAIDIRNSINSKKELMDLKLFIDSGGYSIITGEVPFEKTQLFIDSYHQYLEHHRNDFDYIFSLDIPIWGNQEEHNTINNLYKFNLKSLSQSRELIQNYSDVLLEKFYLVWHFKIWEQYQTWNRIYDELEINNWIKNRAIGGLVSIRKSATNIDYSAFTPLAFKCLNDHLNGPFSKETFTLHVLGINLFQDRFQLLLIEKLFEYYLRKPIRLTYDSANYTISGINQSRNPTIYDFSEGMINKYNILSILEKIIEKVYCNNDLLNGFKEEKQRLLMFQSFSEASVFVPLNVYSNLMVDRYFKHIIDEYNFIEILTSTTFKTKVMIELNNICYDLKNNGPKIFSRNFFIELKNNLDILFDYNEWFINGRDEEELNDFIESFIKERIRFPYKFKKD